MSMMPCNHDVTLVNGGATAVYYYSSAICDHTTTLRNLSMLLFNTVRQADA